MNYYKKLFMVTVLAQGVYVQEARAEQSLTDQIKAENGDVFLFRPELNAKRFNDSCERMCMPTIPEDLFIELIRKFVDLERDWVSTKPDYSLYIRPFMFATDNFIQTGGSIQFDNTKTWTNTGAYSATGGTAIFNGNTTLTVAGSGSWSFNHLTINSAKTLNQNAFL